MGWYTDKFFPRAVDVVLGAPFEATRAQVCQGLCGHVLEVGFGSGRNLPHLPAEVTKLSAIDPSVEARRLAAGRISASGLDVDFVGLDGAAIRLADESVDSVLVTWTLCSIPDVDAAIAEMHRVLRPGGAVHFVEHGLSDRAGVARQQHFLDKPWGRLAGGCHLARDIPALFRSGGFGFTELEVSDFGWPRFATHMFRGVAHVR